MAVATTVSVSGAALLLTGSGNPEKVYLRAGASDSITIGGTSGAATFPVPKISSGDGVLVLKPTYGEKIYVDGSGSLYMLRTGV